MSDYITANNLKKIMELNKSIRETVDRQLLMLMNQYNVREGVKSEEKLAFRILKQHGLIQLPIENLFWGGAIYFIDEKKIPVLNTALPRMNQFFTAWHEVYHLIFEWEDTAREYQISTDLSATERKADYFAARALMGNVYNFYIELKNEDFLDKIAMCMDLYQVPYKAILIQLFEEADLAGNTELLELIRLHFDRKDEDWEARFRKLGLDEELVTPSYVINFGYLEARIDDRRTNEPDVTAHELNQKYLKDLKERIRKLCTKE